MLSLYSCHNENDNGFNSAEKSIESTLEKFPMINKSLEKTREVNLDSLSIQLYKNPNNDVYDEILVFEKKKKFYAIPFSRICILTIGILKTRNRSNFIPILKPLLTNNFTF